MFLLTWFVGLFSPIPDLTEFDLPCAYPWYVWYVLEFGRPSSNDWIGLSTDFLSLSLRFLLDLYVLTTFMNLPWTLEPTRESIDRTWLVLPTCLLMLWCEVYLLRPDSTLCFLIPMFILWFILCFSIGFSFLSSGFEFLAVKGLIAPLSWLLLHVFDRATFPETIWWSVLCPTMF